MLYILISDIVSDGAKMLDIGCRIKFRSGPSLMYTLNILLQILATFNINLYYSGFDSKKNSVTLNGIVQLLVNYTYPSYQRLAIMLVRVYSVSR